METVKTTEIKVREGFNARAEAKDLDGLKLSIERDGILAPLIVKKNGQGVELIAGEANALKLLLLLAVIAECLAYYDRPRPTRRQRR